MKIAIFYTDLSEDKRKEVDSILREMPELHSYTIDDEDEDHVLRTVAQIDISCMVVQQLARVGVHSEYQDLRSLLDIEVQGNQIK